MDKELFQRVTSGISPDVSDELEVFLYNNLNQIASSNPSALLTPEFQAALVVALNNVGPRHSEGLSKCLKDVLDVFIVAHAAIVVDNTTP